MHPVNPMPKDCCLTAVHLAAFIPKSPAYDRRVRSSESARRYRGAVWGSLGVSQVLRSRHLSICAGLPLIALLPSCLLSKPDFYSSGCQEPACRCNQAGITSTKFKSVTSYLKFRSMHLCLCQFIFRIGASSAPEQINQTGDMSSKM